jgi:hypothetical protein
MQSEGDLPDWGIFYGNGEAMREKAYIRVELSVFRYITLGLKIKPFLVFCTSN